MPTDPSVLPRGRAVAAKPLAVASTPIASGSSEKKPTRTLKEPSTGTATAPKNKPAPSRLDKKQQPNSSSVKPKTAPVKKDLAVPKDENHVQDPPGGSETTNVEKKEPNVKSSQDQEPLRQPVSQPQSKQDTGSTEPPLASDPLQLAAQTYTWLYMNSTLDACFSGAEKATEKELGELEKKLEGEEAQLADEKFRHESERLVEFYDELGLDMFSQEAPAIMQSFMSHGEECTRIEAEALQLATTTPSLDSDEPLQAYNVMLDMLDTLQEQASELESSILRLVGSPEPDSHPSAPVRIEDGEGENANQKTDEANSARAQIFGVFAACLPVLRARIANLTMAQELIDSAQENLSLTLRMESMGIE